MIILSYKPFDCSSKWGEVCLRQNNDVLETDGNGLWIKRVGLQGHKNLKIDLWLRGCVGEWEKKRIFMCAWSWFIAGMHSWRGQTKIVNSLKSEASSQTYKIITQCAGGGKNTVWIKKPHQHLAVLYGVGSLSCCLVPEWMCMNIIQFSMSTLYKWWICRFPIRED